MNRALLTLGLTAVLSGTAAAQYPVMPNPYPYSPYYQTPVVQPNVFNPRTQPLSPYLNLFNGINNPNPALNYYYNVRPGTIGGTGLTLPNPQAFPSQGAPARAPFFAQNAPGTDAPVSRQPGPGDILAPAGHPVYFNNTFGAFGGTGRGVAPGLGGIGTSAPPARR